MLTLRPMRRSLNGYDYATEDSLLLADNAEENDLWDPQLQPDRYLYVSGRGRYFVVRQFRHDPERDVLVPYHRWAALKLYRRLPRHHVSEEEAFGPVIEGIYEERDRTA